MSDRTRVLLTFLKPNIAVLLSNDMLVFAAVRIAVVMVYGIWFMAMTSSACAFQQLAT